MKKVLLVVLGVLLIGASVPVMVWGCTTPASNYSSGEVVFQSEGEYTAFKTELADNRGKIYYWDASALTSEPPIIVKFETATSLDYIFPYGDTHVVPVVLSPSTNGWIIAGIIVGCGAAFVASICCCIP